MKSTGRRCAVTHHTTIEDDINDQLEEAKTLLKTKVVEAKTTLGDKHSKEVIKGMINFLVEQL